MTKVRLRYAPSPTGFLHIGNARTALFNYLFARSKGGDFIIRVEDTDLARNIEAGEESQLRNLAWLGIDWDESVDKGGAYGPYRQSERKEIYQQYAEQLIEEGKAYRCYMTSEELEAEREEQIARGVMPRYGGKHANLSTEEEQALIDEGRMPSVRMRVPQNVTYTFDDIVKGAVSFDSDNIGDWVILKKDGMATYNFACAIDDHLMEISHVLRGDDHISNTPKQMMVYEALNWDYPAFGHMTLIVNDQKKKLSKRDAGILQFIEQYKDLGYLPEALFNFITLLGWTPEGEEEVYSQAEFIERFDEKRLSKSPAYFDKQKLMWINNQYMKTKDSDEVFNMAIKFLEAEGRVKETRDATEEDWARRLVALYQPQMSYAAEIVPLSEQFFQVELVYTEDAQEVLEQEHIPVLLPALKSALGELSDEDFTPENIKAAIKAVQKETGFKGKQLFMPVRAAVSGETRGPELPDAISLIGRDIVLERLDALIK